jgi:hypothetical protein
MVDFLAFAVIIGRQAGVCKAAKPGLNRERHDSLVAAACGLSPKPSLKSERCGICDELCGGFYGGVAIDLFSQRVEPFRPHDNNI